MENEKRLNILSLEMDRDAEPSGESQTESTLSNSPESGLTVESSRGGDTDSKKLDERGGWTNEKHHSYLEDLESSFVKQLYSLLGGEETRRLSSSHKSTDQFTVLQNGYRQKLNLGKKRAYTVQLKEEIENSGDKAFTRTSMGHEYPATAEEASGQNFREEVGEKGCNSGVSRKRRRQANYDDSSLNDQVVP
ncbi:Cold-regulated protein 28 [Hirschfeldia incana]|nr:Cold-regulated protein 28 [Hirschfeldia incana]